MVLFHTTWGCQTQNKIRPAQLGLICRAPLNLHVEECLRFHISATVSFDDIGW